MQWYRLLKKLHGASTSNQIEALFRIIRVKPLLVIWLLATCIWPLAISPGVSSLKLEARSQKPF
jgi:hypothetical protein